MAGVLGRRVLVNFEDGRVEAGIIVAVDDVGFSVELSPEETYSLPWSALSEGVCFFLDGESEGRKPFQKAA